MEDIDNKTAKAKNGEATEQNGVSYIVCKQMENNTFAWNERITVIDLSGRNLEMFFDKLKFPLNLLQLNLSHNKFIEVPAIVLNLEKLKVLNLSHNIIEYFDDNPKFCHTLEMLDMSYNNLAGPPYWIWANSSQKLTRLDLSNNENITRSFVKGYFEELLQYSTLVVEVNLQNCKIGKYTEFIATFPKAKSLCLGAENYSFYSTNSLIEIPCQGLAKCSVLERLIICNTHIYTITHNIENYKSLTEINLSLNNLSGIPNEFCNLENLEVCVLSYNKILYLPEEICKLKKLVRLYLHSNLLCMLPNTISKLQNLKTLDLYDNNLNEVPNLNHLEELDLAQNFLEEPENLEYIEKKQMLRLIHENRYNGRKEVINRSDEYSEKESETEDDEELYEILHNSKKIDDPPHLDPPSSPEDWDSDDYWIPFYQSNIPTVSSPWLCFVKRKMREGNFCPMDAHPISIVEQVRYEKLCNPQVNHESDGQFDDYSSDDT